MGLPTQLLVLLLLSLAARALPPKLVDGDTTAQLPLFPPHPPSAPLDSQSLLFHPRLSHSAAARSDAPQVLLSDHPADAPSPGALLRTRPLKVYRPRSKEKFQRARWRSLMKQESEDLEWDLVEVPAPDIEDRGTLLELAKITANAYALPGQKYWWDLDGKWNKTLPFGWEREEDGFRGNVFVSTDNSTVIISIKGTSLFGDGPTVTRDKLNDNRLFSCCCARVDYTWAWQTVCDCFSGGWTCDQTCLENSLVEEDLFYSVGLNLYNNVTSLFPKANIWLAGHSLGGGVAALLGATFGVPTVTFEAPGERLAAQRLHLPFPPASTPSIHPIWAVYHTGDPIPQGACTGLTSLCAKAGYALENRCHLGKTIVYDTVARFGWRMEVRKHTIAYVINNVLNEDWDPENGRAVPEAKEEEDCVDCHKWEFGAFKTVTTPIVAPTSSLSNLS